jgi:hypothetical protein
MMELSDSAAGSDMKNNTADGDDRDKAESLLSRRDLLKAMTGAPLVVSFGLFTSPVMRFLKPSMQPGNFFQSADLPTADHPPVFNMSDLPDVWNCLPFIISMKYLVFNPEQYEVRTMPGFVIRTGEDKIVAFSRRCPKQRDHILNFVLPTADGSCGCPDSNCKGYCIGYAKTPSLFCHCDKSVYDVARDGRAICGSAYSARQFTIKKMVRRLA